MGFFRRYIFDIFFYISRCDSRRNENQFPSRGGKSSNLGRVSEPSLKNKYWAHIRVSFSPEPTYIGFERSPPLRLVTSFQPWRSQVSLSLIKSLSSLSVIKVAGLSQGTPTC